MVIKPLDGASIRRSRAALVARADLAGPSLAHRLSQQADGWFEALSVGLPADWSLMATGGYAGGALCPGSDIDVVLLHPHRVGEPTVREVAEQIWYPLWDSGLKLSPGAHSVRSLLSLAADDLVTATAVLRVRRLAGDQASIDSVQRGALEMWRKRPMHWLKELRGVSEQRWAKFGEVASLLEPDLKDGRGGMRDHDVLRWALLTGRDDVLAAMESPLEHLAGPADHVLATRCELHRVTGRTTNVLLLQDQDSVAEAMGYADADVLMLKLAAAARSIDWASERFWRRIERITRKGGKPASHPRPLSDKLPGVTVVDDEVDISAAAELDDQSFVFRVAAASARAGYPLSPKGLQVLANNTSIAEGEPWTERTLRAFVSLLGAGEALVPAIEALEQYDLFSRLLPEWRHVRSLPQRNAFHTYTVDRHLLRTVANANELVRGVARPDLLLVGALLHDIGKGYPEDHTDKGLELVDRICPRMGFSVEDSATIRSLVEHHLLLSETAMRRDLGDPRTASNVADAIEDPGRLELLRALTEADSLATGPSAWSSWKESLIDQLVDGVVHQLNGQARGDDANDGERRFSALIELVRADGALHTEREHVGDFVMLRIATRDRPGLFAAIAGTLALHGIDVLSAEAYTSPDGIAVDQFQILPSPTHSPNWSRIDHDLRAVLDGSVDIAARLEQRMRNYARAHRRAQAATPPLLEVRISNDASDSTTMIDVRAPDAQAVLYRLSSTLAGHGLDIRSAKVATLGHEVVDVFYVQTPGGVLGQIPSVQHDELRERLKQSLS